MYKGNKGDRHAGLHYQCVTEVSGNINANANIKIISDKIKKRKLKHIHSKKTKGIIWVGKGYF